MPKKLLKGNRPECNAVLREKIGFVKSFRNDKSITRCETAPVALRKSSTAKFNQSLQTVVFNLNLLLSIFIVSWLCKKGKLPVKDRFLKNYTKIKQLGSGGCGVVWEAVDDCGKTVAIKQVKKGSGNANSSLLAVVTETKIGCMLFPNIEIIGENLNKWTQTIKNKQTSEELPDHRVNNFAQLFRSIETPHDYWMVFEKCGRTLHDSLFEIKGEFHRNSRVYVIKHTELYSTLSKNPNVFKNLIRKLLIGVTVLNEKLIVHADIKPDNILVKYNEISTSLEVKLIDLGSAFSFRKPQITGSNTPEYAPPELHSCVSSTRKLTNEEVLVIMRNKSNPYAFDMWSIGCIILEILSGFPLWFSYKSKVLGLNGKFRLIKGLFSSSLRDPSKILAHQELIVTDLSKALRPYPTSHKFLGGSSSENYKIGIDLLSKMLSLDPQKRISPTDALSHPFLTR